MHNPQLPNQGTWTAIVAKPRELVTIALYVLIYIVYVLLYKLHIK